jgi:hypothetical protein
VPDGRYLARGEGGDEGSQRVLVVETLAAPPPARRRRRKPKQADPREEPQALPLARLTAVRAHEPFASEQDAARWLAEAGAEEGEVDALLADALALANRALHARAVAAADPGEGELRPERAARVRIGFGSGEEVAAGRYTAASVVDVRGASPRRRREEDLRPQERLAAVLGGRESLDACETLLLRARADLDAGRMREAALQLRVALEALLVELAGALADPGHDEDMAELEARKSEAGAVANAALSGELSAAQEDQVRALTELCERIVRRRRVLRG